MTNAEIQELKRNVGRKPFDARLRFDRDFAKCPFHQGDGKTLHLERKEGGVWVATCFSTCSKSFDAIAFVQKLDNLTFHQAVEVLQGRKMDNDERPKPLKKVMTAEEWKHWGREITQADVDRLAKSRPHSHTADLECFQRAACRVKGEYIGFPYFYLKTEAGEAGCYTVKLRHMDTKELLQESSVSQHGFFNLSTVNPLDDVYVFEGEPDALTGESFGFASLSVTTGKQKEFDARGLEILKSANRIFLVGDQEEVGRECMDNLARHLPPDRTRRISFNDASAKDVGELAKKLGQEFVPRFEELRDEAARPWVVRNIPTLGALSTEPPKWLVHELFPHGGVTMLAGNMGSMKSLLALFAAGAIEAGTEFLGRKVLKPTKVLYVDRENSENDIGVRKHRIGLPNTEVHYWGDWLPDGTPNLEDPKLAEFAASGGFLVFDSLQQWMGSGVSENDNGAMTELMRKFRRLARLGAGVLVLHHAPKYGDAAWRGGTSIPNNTEMAIGISKEDNGVVKLREIRFRGCAKWEMDARVDFGEKYTLEVLRDETKSQAIEKAKIRKLDEVEEFKKFVTKNPSATQREIQDVIGINLKNVKAVGEKAGYCQKDGQWVPSEAEWMLGQTVN